MGDQADTEGRREFLKLEHAAVLEKVRHASSDLYRTETVIPLAMAVMYAWLFGGEFGPREVPLLLWWIPLFAALFGAARQWIRYRSLWGSHRYLGRIEREIYGEASKPQIRDDKGPVFGWERYWLGAVQPPRKFWKWRLTDHALMRSLFWLVLILAAFALALYPTITDRSSPPAPREPAAAVEVTLRQAPIESSAPAVRAEAAKAPSKGDGDLLAILAGLWIPLLIVAGGFLVRAVSFLVTARWNHRTKMMELAIDTANREFSTHATGGEALKTGSLPMSAYVIFHVVLFSHLERVDPDYPAAQALEDTLHEVEKIFDVYAKSKIPEYRRLWDFLASKPDAQ